MGSVSLKVWNDHKYKTKEGYTLWLVVRQDGKRKVYKTGLHVPDPAQWDAAAEQFHTDAGRQSVHPDAWECNKFILDLKSKVNDILSYYHRNGIQWTIPQFEEKLFNPNHITTGNVSEFLKNEIGDLLKRGHFGNSKVYERLLKSLQHFDRNFENRLFHEIDYNYLRRYDSYMESNRNSGNTRAIQMRTLRALFNKAVKEGVVDEKYYPFGMRGFSVYKLREKTRKKYLSSEEMTRIIDARFDNLRLETVRRTFLNMFYLQGMAFIDAAHLRGSVNYVAREDVDYISYKRNKTLHQPGADYIEVPVTPQIRDNFEWFKKHGLLVEDYLFPIVSMPGKRDQELYSHVKSRYKKVNDALKDMADALRIPRESMSTYVSRHSFAMDLQEHDVPREVIKELMGHQDISTTQTYLDSFPASTRARYLGHSPVYNRDPMTNPKRVPDVKIPHKKRGRKM